jgi:tetratricopeptide (TPR) repeat protein
MSSLFCHTGPATASCLLVLLAGTAAAQQPTRSTAEESLGQVDFEVSCTPEAGPVFERAAGLLHHMMYARAEREFEALAAAHPECAMAHWGIAMTQFQPLWPGHPDGEALQRGRDAVAAARRIGLPTNRERAYIDAVDAFYGDLDADGPTRLSRFERAMADVHRMYPDDLNAAAFYALARLATAPGAPDPRAQRAAAAELLAAVHERSPTHPGAIHYAIHAHDVDGMAAGGVRFAAAYGDIAPAVPHALHMPSHIYVRLGDWDEVIAWNDASAAAALNFPVGDHVSHHHAHALDYLMYAQLQRGNDDAARAVLDELRARENYQPTFVSGYALAAMPARWTVERRAWDEAAALPEREPATFPWERFPGAEAMTYFARGLGSARTADAEGARAAVDRLAELKANAEGGGDTYWANQIEVQRLSVAAWIAHAEGQGAEAVRHMRAAAELAATMEKDPTTPGDLQPPYELLGDLLLELGRPDEALAAYETSLETWPARFNSVLGAAQAAEAAGDATRASSYYRAVGELAPAGADRPGLEAGVVGK